MMKLRFSTAFVLASVCLTPLCGRSAATEETQGTRSPRPVRRQLDLRRDEQACRLDARGEEVPNFRTTPSSSSMARFLQHIEVNHVVGDPSKVTKSLFLWTYDPKLKQYVGWTFQSSGNMGKAIGTWDATTKTLTHSNVEVPPNTSSRLTQHFRTKAQSTARWSSLTTMAKLFDMVWTRKRQAGLAWQAAS